MHVGAPVLVELGLGLLDRVAYEVPPAPATVDRRDEIGFRVECTVRAVVVESGTTCTRRRSVVVRRPRCDAPLALLVAGGRPRARPSLSWVESVRNVFIPSCAFFRSVQPGSGAPGVVLAHRPGSVQHEHDVQRPVVPHGEQAVALHLQHSRVLTPNRRHEERADMHLLPRPKTAFTGLQPGDRRPGTST